MGAPRTGLKKIFDYHIPKNAVNRYLFRHAGGETRPVYYDVDALCPALHELEKNWRVIRGEFNAALGGEMPKYHDVDPGEAEISAKGDPAKRWRVFLLFLLGYKPAKNRAMCPQTCALLDNVPGLIQAFFSVLDPRKNVPAHEGPYVGYLRYHLGLMVPSDNPPFIKVNGQPYTWAEGEGVLFDDTWTHEVVNNSDGTRAVLVVDILRPMPAPASYVNRFMTNVLAKYTYGRQVMKRMDNFVADAKK